MSLADRTPEPKRRGGVCSVAVLYEQISKDDAETLRRWLADPQIEGSAILARLREEYNGREDEPDLITFGYTPLRRHAAGDCKCGDL